MKKITLRLLNCRLRKKSRRKEAWFHAILQIFQTIQEAEIEALKTTHLPKTNEAYSRSLL